MRTRENGAVIVVAAVVAGAATLALAGCVQPSPHVIPTSTSSTAPVFASDAAALAAAKKAYVAYLAVSDAISNAGGSDATRLAPFVTKKWLPKEINSYATFEKTGERFSGKTGFDRFLLQSREVTSDGDAEVIVYVCANVSETRLIDPSGADITPASRQDVYPIVANFESDVAASTKLLFAGSQPWSGKSFCS